MLAAPSLSQTRAARVFLDSAAAKSLRACLRRQGAAWLARAILTLAMACFTACSVTSAPQPKPPRPPLFKATAGLPAMTHAVPAKEVTVPMVHDPDHTVPVVIARLNGGPGFPMVIDSGGNHTIVGESRARLAELKPLGASGLITTAFGNREKTELALARELTLGPLTMHNVPMLVHGFRPSKLTEMLGGELNVLGTPALSAFSYVSFDYKRQKVTFSYSRPFRPPWRRSHVLRLPLQFTSDGHLTVPLTLPNGKTSPAIVDTGYDGVLLISPRMLEAAGLSHYAAEGRPVRAVGPGAELAGRVFMLPGLRMDGQLLPDVEAWTGQIEEPLLIGSGLLRYFKATFDFERMILWLERQR